MAVFYILFICPKRKEEVGLGTNVNSPLVASGLW